ncbi:MAG: hypothetical protein LBR47_01330, partial [Spirochaetaceae bacterium]|nr:hypothetical protein [Spirochaetaceae bacterium]
MNILFHTNQITERGTEVALYDYAEANDVCLHNQSYIAAPFDRILNKNRYEQFLSRFSFCAYKTPEDLKEFIKENQ